MRAWTLMTALPPTKGHFALMDFASQLGDEPARVIVATQPSEPMSGQRFAAVAQAARRTTGPVEVLHLNRELPQDPSTTGFWDMWKGIMLSHGFKPGDLFTSSEIYGARLAEVCEGHYLPFDPDRELIHTKATRIRENLAQHFADLLPEFQPKMRSTITVWGAESTGKTTLSRELATAINGHWVFEWARPYLETIATYSNSRLGDLGTDINVESMTDIWHGQYAVQRITENWYDKPFVVQDTDLYSTIGYWEQPHWQEALGPVPEGLILDAKATQSDLYLITQANIPFESDPLRYGGDHQESPDSFWIDVAERYGLNYRVIPYSNFHERLSYAMQEARAVVESKQARIAHERIEYEKKLPDRLTLETMARNPGRLVRTA
jgi:NadR type nicotinamide-nucleotide adenylyltransferase